MAQADTNALAIVSAYIGEHTRDIAPDPASGTIPTSCLVWNVTDSALKRHPKFYWWEITMEGSASVMLESRPLRIMLSP